MHLTTLLLGSLLLAQTPTEPTRSISGDQMETDWSASETTMQSPATADGTDLPDARLPSPDVSPVVEETSPPAAVPSDAPNPMSEPTPAMAPTTADGYSPPATGSDPPPFDLKEAPDTVPSTDQTESGLAPSEPGLLRRTPPELVADALVLDDRSALAGSPLTLFEALSSSQDRLERVDVAHAYWHLAMAVANYRSLFDRCDRLAGLAVDPLDEAMLDTARSSAAAALSGAELAAVSAQHELAEAASLRPGSELPLTSDLPHVGPYRTYFDEVFSIRSLPDRTRLVDRRLQIRRRVIDVRATALVAAEEVVDAVEDAYASGRADLPAVLAAVDRWTEQSQALMKSVCDYNHDIADYALAVAGPETSASELVAMLIRHGSGAMVPAGSATGANEPFTGGPRSILTNEVKPTNYQPIIGTGTSAPRVPTLAPPRELAQPIDTLRSTPTLPSAGSEAKAPSLMPDVPDAEPAKAIDVDQPLVPVAPNRSDTFGWRANRPVQGGTAAAGLYPGLINEEPAVQAKLLSASLHWTETLGDDAGEPIELKDCLSVISATNRGGLIDDYWTACQRAAEYQVLRTKANLLDQLLLSAPAEGEGSVRNAQRSRLTAAQTSARAELLEAQMNLLAAQFELTRWLGRLDSPWLLPSTSPHSGPYLLKLDAQPPELVETWAVKRLAATIPARSMSVQHHAAAVIEADSARAAVAAAYAEGTRPVDDVLMSIDRQTTETLAFLATLSEYNKSIGEYALTVLPATVPGDRLVETLVVTQTPAE